MEGDQFIYQQGFAHYTPYSLVQVQVDGNIEGLGCMSYDFCSENIECISAWELLQTIKTKQHSFIEKEAKLLQYVTNRSLVDVSKAEMDFSIYEKDLVERHIRISKLKELYERKRERLSAFQSGKDIWKSRNYSAHN